MNEDAIIKRIVKCYLYHKGEATSKMIANHLEYGGYGLRKPVLLKGLSRKMKIWSSSGKSGSWFRVKNEYKNGELWWSLK